MASINIDLRCNRLPAGQEEKIAFCFFREKEGWGGRIENADRNVNVFIFFLWLWFSSLFSGKGKWAAKQYKQRKKDNQSPSEVPRKPTHPFPPRTIFLFLFFLSVFGKIVWTRSTEEGKKSLCLVSSVCGGRTNGWFSVSVLLFGGRRRKGRIRKVR